MQRTAPRSQLSEHPRLGGAYLHAGREQALRDPVVAKGALVRGLRSRIQIAGAVGTGLDTIAAADTVGLID